MGLKLSEEKTKVTHITEGFKFLGFWIIREIGDSGKMVPKVLIPKEAIKRFRHEIHRFTSLNTSESVSAKFRAFNRLIRGWCQYYRCTSSPSIDFKKLDHEIFKETAHWLGRKFKISMPNVMQRYSGGKTLRTKSITLVMPTDHTAKKRLVKTWQNPYTGKEKIEREYMFSYENIWAGQEDRDGWADLREEVMTLKGTTCSICGTKLHPSEVEIDEITPRASFKDPKEAERMGNLRPLCTPCHRAKTKIDRKVLSRMR
jgi:hypothetical protein